MKPINLYWPEPGIPDNHNTGLAAPVVQAKNLEFPNSHFPPSEKSFVKSWHRCISSSNDNGASQVIASSIISFALSFAASSNSLRAVNLKLWASFRFAALASASTNTAWFSNRPRRYSKWSSNLDHSEQKNCSVATCRRKSLVRTLNHEPEKN